MKRPSTMNPDTMPPHEDRNPKPDEEARAQAPAPKDGKPRVLGTATWLGEGDDGPKVNTWNGQSFKVGEAVEITNPQMWEKAKANRFYKVNEYAEPEKVD